MKTYEFNCTYSEFSVDAPSLATALKCLVNHIVNNDKSFSIFYRVNGSRRCMSDSNIEFLHKNIRESNLFNFWS